MAPLRFYGGRRSYRGFFVGVAFMRPWPRIVSRITSLRIASVFNQGAMNGAPTVLWGPQTVSRVFCRGRIYATLAAHRIAGYVITYRIRL